MRFVYAGVIAFGLFFSGHLFAQTETLLVLDAKNIAQLPRHFRTTSDSPNNSNINTTGLANLHIIGSADFSKHGLEKVLQQLKLKNIMIIDLREESHALLNGNAVSWYGPQNAANAGKSAHEIESIQANLLENLLQTPQTTVFTILKKNAAGEVESTKPNEFVVSRVLSEAELAKQLDLDYQRLYVQDMHAPRPDQVERFLQITKTLPADEWIYFHCRAGIGRTTTFMAMFDMLHNAKEVSFEEILARQADIGGKSLTKLPKPGSFKYQPAVERLEFLKKFYQYARDNKGLTWSAWLANQALQH